MRAREAAVVDNLDDFFKTYPDADAALLFGANHRFQDWYSTNIDRGHAIDLTIAKGMKTSNNPLNPPTTRFSAKELVLAKERLRKTGRLDTLVPPSAYDDILNSRSKPSSFVEFGKSFPSKLSGFLVGFVSVLPRFYGISSQIEECKLANEKINELISSLEIKRKTIQSSFNALE